MSTLQHWEAAAREPAVQGRGRRSSPLSWRWSDRLALAMAWGAGILLCLIAAAIVVYFGVRGIQYLRPSLLLSRPQVGTSQAGTGGFLDPILGTALLTLIGVALATPLAVSAAVWIVEYGRPSWLARFVESSIEIVAGTPDILIALFGLTIFQLSLFAPFSFTAQGGGVYGRSFIAAGAMMSLIAVPAIYTATRDGLQGVPVHMREAAYALGKTKVATTTTARQQRRRMPRSSAAGPRPTRSRPLPPPCPATPPSRRSARSSSTAPRRPRRHPASAPRSGRSRLRAPNGCASRT